ncbi:hypothetical protein Cabther_B0359 [Chloracidobacterium thermophilum B]|uniref:Uncharacterized protein n=1 Tax=Chloracidobacterium thermophilum (strain B) TaxID=981222 RepID=G2LL06_CHLTF|nr:hypothetical protein Cabther_B0359 [Chloracidobacterium thermophilum B]
MAADAVDASGHVGQLGGCRLKHFQLAAGNDDIGASRDEMLRDGFTDAAAAAGDDGNLAGK